MNEITELSIKELFSRDQYIVPIYQRNYAWQEEQIEQLILDIWDYAQRPEIPDYYIGSLVVFSREQQHDLFEIIDGQQRHTALSILLSVLKNEFCCAIGGITGVNLSFDSRKRSKVTLKALFANESLTDIEPSIANAYGICKKYLLHVVTQTSIPRFCDYLLSGVKLLRVIVPHDTDLNHYFEIMNNRGEQLEKHEILKARLMDTLNKNDIAELNAFASIWDTCSDMNRYVQYGFAPNIRHLLFGDSLNNVVEDFNFVKKNLDTSNDIETVKSILETIKDTAVASSDPETNEPSSEHFNSVINFSNFLLHALRIYFAPQIKNSGKNDISLDDKSLLQVFNEHLSNIDAKQFAMTLLKVRFLFDKYIIKREWDDKWSLKQIRWYKSHDNINYVNTFDDEALNNHIILIISMFHVSFPSLIYKHWLSGVLNYLYYQCKDINASEYLEFLEQFDNKLFFDRFSSSPKDYQEIIFSNLNKTGSLDESHLYHGTNTQNYIFNRLDYLIWKKNKYFAGTINETLKLPDLILNNFSFSFRSSVEHYYPQNPHGGDRMTISESLPNGVDSFGNLCLISRSNNSKLSNYLPQAKKEHYRKSTSVESLKQQLMMKYEVWDPKDPTNIISHEKEMIKLLKSKPNHIDEKN